jgi:hypothetical protein
MRASDLERPDEQIVALYDDGPVAEGMLVFQPDEAKRPLRMAQTGKDIYAEIHAMKDLEATGENQQQNVNP